MASEFGLGPFGAGSFGFGYTEMAGALVAYASLSDTADTLSVYPGVFMSGSLLADIVIDGFMNVARSFMGTLDFSVSMYGLMHMTWSMDAVMDVSVDLVPVNTYIGELWIPTTPISGSWGEVTADGGFWVPIPTPDNPW